MVTLLHLHVSPWATEIPMYPMCFFPKTPSLPFKTWGKGARSQRSYGSPKAEAWWKKPWWLGATLSEQCLFQMLFNWLLRRDLEISESPHSTNNNDQQCFFWSFYVYFARFKLVMGFLQPPKKNTTPTAGKSHNLGYLVYLEYQEYLRS